MPATPSTAQPPRAAPAGDLAAIHRLLQADKVAKADRLAERALRRAPGDPTLLKIRARAAWKMGKPRRAVMLADRAVATVPEDDEALVMNAHFRHRSEGAGAAIAFLRAREEAGGLGRRARTALAELQVYSNAMLDAVVTLNRELADPEVDGYTLELMGRALVGVGRYAEADRALEIATRIDPARAAPLMQRAHLFNLAKLGEPLPLFRRALTVDPDNDAARIFCLFGCLRLCDWDEYDRLLPGPLELPSLGQGASTPGPWPCLPFADDPAAAQARARAAVGHVMRNAGLSDPVAAPLPAQAADGRIRVGYFSNDFYNHATLQLMRGLIRHHDRTRFELHCFDFGKSDRMGAELRAGFERVHDIHTLSDDAVAARARAAGIDVAIDLKGNTQGNRIGMFLRGLAPVQINYLGYPGTMGTGALQYLIADPTVVPDGAERHYDEAIIRLPTCYLPNDDRRRAGDAPSRAALSLPEDAVVLACLNNSYKISRPVFGLWMDALRNAPEAVLWLLDGEEGVNDRLRREAGRAGVDPARLIFAPKVGPIPHVSRLQQADLFLDTFHVNAHTLAADAICAAGLPLLTRAGRQFAARVGASFLHAAGLPELITETSADYAARLQTLAGDRDALTDLRARLEANRAHAPLFSSAGYTAAFEAALEVAHERARAGAPPSAFSVPDLARLSKLEFRSKATSTQPAEHFSQQIEITGA